MTGDFLIVKKYLSNPLVTGTIFLTLAGTTSRFMGFFFRIFLNNVMGSTGLGLYQLVIPLMSVCMSLCCNGFQTATSKIVAEKPQNRQIILICAIIMSATIALLLTIIMYSNANYISLCILSEPRCTELVKALSFSILPAAIHSCINGYYYGLKKATFKISLDENLITALKVLDKLGLRSIKPVQVGDVKVVPRDVVAACAPQPKDIGDEMTGKMLVGVQCIGKKDGKEKEYFLYQPFDNQESIERWGTQAVTAQTGFGAALALELIGRGIWKEAGVYAPEYFDPKPYLELMKESGYKYGIIEK